MSLMSQDELMKDADRRMNKAIDALKADLAKLRTGRAHPSLLEHIMISYYGNPTPLSQVASITVLDARTLSIAPWEKNLTAAIEKGILQSGLGLNPTSAGDVIRIPMPPLTEERRRDMTKIVRHEGENGRIAVRNIRRDSNTHLKELEKKKLMAEDDLRKSEDKIQKMTDQHIHTIDQMVTDKEKELMSM